MVIKKTKEYIKMNEQTNIKKRNIELEIADLKNVEFDYLEAIYSDYIENNEDKFAEILMDDKSVDEKDLLTFDTYFKTRLNYIKDLTAEFKGTIFQELVAVYVVDAINDLVEKKIIKVATCLKNFEVDNEFETAERVCNYLKYDSLLNLTFKLVNDPNLEEIISDLTEEAKIEAKEHIYG